MTDNRKFIAKWIWHPDKQTQDGVNQFVEFRREIDIDASTKGSQVFISVDSHYELWINGVIVDWNQYPGWPEHRFYNSIEVGDYLKPGRNVIAVRAQYRGDDFIIYAKGKAGLIFEMAVNGKTVLASDKTWICRKAATYKSGAISKMTRQARFNFEYNAQNEDDWFKIEYKPDQDWSYAQELSEATGGYWKTLEHRPVDMLQISKPKSVKVVTAGSFNRSSELATVALTVSRESKQLQFSDPKVQKYLGWKLSGKLLDPLTIEPLGNQSGLCLVFDLGEEESGYLVVDAQASAGTVFDIAHGEFLDNGVTRCEIDGRNFADRYICKDGQNNWQFSFNRIGCRYIQLHIPRIEGIIKLYSISVMPCQYPFKHQGGFECSDISLNKLWEVGRRTLELCANEHYEDCPWREQALYGTDHRYHALYGYYTFGETKFTAACWDLLGAGLNDDGLLELVAPGRLPVNIPSFTYHWISAVWELLLYSGQTEPAAKQFDRICIILDKALENLNPAGVVENLKGDRYWHLYEWTYALKGDLSEYAAIIDPDAAAFDAMNNLLLIESLCNAAKIAEEIKDNRGEKYLQAATDIARSFHSVFWNDTKKLYASFRRGNMIFHYSQFVQAYAVKQGVVPSETIICDLMKRITNSGVLHGAEMPSKMFVYDVLLSGGTSYESYILNDIHGTFCEMIEMGATSLWEVIGGEERFQCAGSLCHGWTAVLNYFAGSRILGVRPLSTGFRTFEVAPRILGIKKAKGTIPTPEGCIEIEWQDIPSENKFRLWLHHPKNLIPTIKSPDGRELILMNE